MSGYTDDTVMESNLVESGIAFLRKPFTPLGLAAAMRGAIDSAASPVVPSISAKADR
jgi:hypothetical protein